MAVLSSSLAHAGAALSLADDGHTAAQLICNGQIVLDEVYFLRLTLSNGALLISWRESLQNGAPEKVLVLTHFGQCQAEEINPLFHGPGRFSIY